MGGVKLEFLRVRKDQGKWGKWFMWDLTPPCCMITLYIDEKRREISPPSNSVNI